MRQTDRLEIRDFAQISHADLTFGDLTVFVGAQGTGKSLALQWFKVVKDGRQLIKALHEAGHTADSLEALIDIIFGAGMGRALSAGTSIKLNGKTRISGKGNVGGKKNAASVVSQIGSGRENVFFIPAHRSMLISDGWAAPFRSLTVDTPVVARIFSQNLFDRFNDRSAGPLFPLPRVLKQEYRAQIDQAVFHSGRIGIEERQRTKRLRLSYGRMHLPFMTWTAGQREFTPLLLGLYHLLPPRKLLKQPDVDYVVIEEPEMGLHPQAITVVLLLVLDLLWRGYRVVLSTHSPHVLTAIWMLKRLQEHDARWQLLCDAFGVPRSQQLQKVAKAALEKDYRVHLLAFESDGRVKATDISALDPASDDERMSGWGGLTEFSSRFGDAVRTAVNESL